MKKKKINSVYIISLTEIFLCVIAIIVSSFLFASSNQNLKENEIDEANYNKDAVPGSLREKANLVKKYNEQNNK